MVFNSISYLLFLGLTATAYYIFPGKYRWMWLLLASAAYYLSFIPVYFLLIAALVTVNYFLAFLLPAEAKGKKTVFILVIAVNIGILAFFKYFSTLFPGCQPELYRVDYFFRTDPVQGMVLALGLSYLVFTVLSYQIEIRRNNLIPERHFGYFSLYLLFFPRIAQGPIERPQQMLKQVRQIHAFDYDMVVSGLKLMLWGFFKKLVVADRLAIYVNSVYDNAGHHNGTTLALATCFIFFQVYADFSGYTDIAIGSASIFGIKLSHNFNRPFFATSVKEFWNRWHITLSTWLRDYLFLPLAFYLSSKMKKPAYLYISTDKWIYLAAIMVTFAVCGIWHGEGLAFLVWGLIFGLYMTCSNWSAKLSREFRKRIHISKSSKGFTAYKILLTFLLVSFTFIFFRTASLEDSWVVISRIFTTTGAVFYESPTNLIYAITGIILMMAVEFKEEFFEGKIKFLYHKNAVVRYGTIAALVMLILLTGVFDGGQFIYFQF